MFVSIHRYYEADTESDDDFSLQIREQTSRIQKEIELERKLKHRQAQRSGTNQHPQHSQHPQLTEFPANGQPGYATLDSRQHTMPRYKGSTSYSNLPAAQELHAFHSYSASTPDVSALLKAEQVGVYVSRY